MVAILAYGTAVALPPEEGKTIFLSRCASCHNVNKVAVGPALAGIDERRTLEWITKFVNSSQTLIRNGDTSAIAVFEKFNRVPMPDHPDLGAADISNIVEYIRSQAKVSGGDEAPFSRPRTLAVAYKPLSLKKDWMVFAGFFGVVIILVASLLFAVRVAEQRRSRAKDLSGKY
jgi:cytochrome c551/c552